MKRFVLKKMIFVLLPLLLVAFSPIHVMVCQGAMKDCSPCCPKMMKGGERFYPQVAASKALSCCTVYQWEGITLTNPALKADDLSKAKFFSFSLSAQKVSPFPLTSEKLKDSISEFHPLPSSLFILKQSFLI